MTNSIEEDNLFCPRELIIVKCSVRSSVLRWRIDEASFAIPETIQARTVTFFAEQNQEGLHSYINTTIGRLDFYQNTTYIASSPVDSSIDSELHMHLNDTNNFVEVSCLDAIEQEKSINITLLHGTLNIIRVKLLYYVSYNYYIFNICALRNTSYYSNQVDNNTWF